MVSAVRAEVRGVSLPPDLIQLFAEKFGTRWTGTIALNFKEGEIVAFELTEKHRISRETRVSRAL